MNTSCQYAEIEIKCIILATVTADLLSLHEISVSAAKHTMAKQVGFIRI